MHAVRDHVTVGRVWWQRLGTLALFMWILSVLSVGFGLAMGQLGVTIGTLEELTTYRQVTLPTPTANQPAASQPAPLTFNSATGTIQITRTINSSLTTTKWQREVNTDYEYYAAFMTLVYALAFTLGFALAALMAVTMHHWPRWGYLIPILLITPLIGYGVWYVWRVDNPHLSDWAAPYIVWLGTANIAGGVAGAFLGRPFTRLLVRLVLPPKIRQVLAFLWLADGKPLPNVSEPRS